MNIYLKYLSPKELTLCLGGRLGRYRGLHSWLCVGRRRVASGVCLVSTCILSWFCSCCSLWKIKCKVKILLTNLDNHDKTKYCNRVSKNEPFIQLKTQIQSRYTEFIILGYSVRYRSRSRVFVRLKYYHERNIWRETFQWVINSDIQDI